MSAENQLQLDADILKKGRMVLRAINHPLRQKIMQMIHASGRLIVTDIYAKLGVEQSIASQHLAILRREGFVLPERQHRFIFYSLNYQRIKEVQDKAKELAETVKDKG